MPASPMRGAQHLTLFVPGLSGPTQVLADGGASAATLDAIVEPIGLTRLETFLSRATRSHAAFPGALEAQLLSLFEVPAPGQGDWPVAAVTHAFDSGQRDEKWYARWDPVFLRANLREVVLSDARGLSLELDEARRFAGMVNTHFAAESWRIEVLHPERWYLGFEQAQGFTTTPLSLVSGSNIEDCLPSGIDAPRWHAVLNEVQMLLHDCELNRERQLRGLPPVNGLWLWGGGRRPAIAPPRWERVYSSDGLARALSSLCGTGAAGVPAGLQDWCEELGGPARHLVVLDELYQPARLARVEQWYAGLQNLNARWFEHIPTALSSGLLASVELLVPRLGRYTASRRSLARWWRRRRSFGRLVTGRVQIGQHANEDR